MATKKAAKKEKKSSKLGKSGVNMHDFVMGLFKKNKNATEEQIMSAVKKEFPQWEPKKYYGIWRREAGLAPAKREKKAAAKKVSKKKATKKADEELMDDGETME